jgi:hypothetical protein
MGKKYLETKKDTLESSILGVWKTAIEEGDAREAAARMDGRTKGYREHRSKLETNRQRREDKKLAVKKEEPETINGAGEHAFEVGTDRYAEYTQKITPGQIEEQLLKMSEEEFDTFVEDLDDDLLEGVEMILDETIDLNEKGFLKKLGKKIAGRIPGTDAHSKRIIQKAADRKSQRDTKAKAVKAKQYLKKKKKAGVFGAEFNPAEETELDEKHDTHVDPKDRDELDGGKNATGKGGAETAKKMKKAKEPEPGQMAEASGDKEAYKKFFDAALKKFKVSSPAELKGDDKKKFFDYIDKNWEGDNEKAEGAMSQVREFKIQSMKAALAQVWGMEEGKNPFAEGELPPALKKAIDAKKKDKEEKDEEVEKNGKTATGKKAAVIDVKPKIKDGY